jgi:hypothetical protein
MTEIISNMNEWVLFLGGLFSLLSATCGAFFAVKNFITMLKTKQNAEIWALVMEIADNAMKEAEASKASGADKKSMVINAVKAGAEASGLDISDFLTQLDLYIDQTIEFVNKMKDAEK